MAEDTPTPPATGTATGGGICWKCGFDRDAYGDGSRRCSNCDAPDEPIWARVAW